MKGIILAGGQGSRLSPLTDITNKFLMPVYDKLMIEYSVYSLRNAGVTEIAIILGNKSAGETMNYLKSGAKYDVQFTYFYQDQPLGVPNALYYAREWAKYENVMVLCADNIIYDDLFPFIKQFNQSSAKALISTKEFSNMLDLQRFAVLEYDIDKLVGIVEKPIVPPSNQAFCGIQIYDYTVWEKIELLSLSSRGEYEITDVLREYIKLEELMTVRLAEKWFDCGNKDSLFEAQQYAFQKVNTGIEPEVLF